MRKLGIMLVLVTILWLPRAASANLLVNASFETGDFSGWTQAGDLSFTLVTGTFGDVAPQDGSFQAALGPVDGLGFLIQSVLTTAGSTYDLDFWLHNFGGTPSEFRVSWDGGVIYDTIDSGAFSYTHLFFPGLLATGPTTTLEFAFQQGPSFFLLDNINLEATAVPEPGSLVLLGSGLFSLAAWRKKRGPGA